MEIRDQIDIAAPPSVVFALTIDVEQWPSITPTVTTAKRLDDGPLKVGSRAQLTQPGLPPTVWTVSALEQDRLFAWDATVRGTHMTASHVIEPTAAGCRNTLSMTVTGRGSWLFGLLFGSKVRRTLSTENESFRREAERRA